MPRPRALSPASLATYIRGRLSELAADYLRVYNEVAPELTAAGDIERLIAIPHILSRYRGEADALVALAEAYRIPVKRPDILA